MRAQALSARISGAISTWLSLSRFGKSSLIFARILDKSNPILPLASRYLIATLTEPNAWRSCDGVIARLQIPGHVHDDDALIALHQQHRLQHLGPLIMKEIVIPVALN